VLRRNSTNELSDQPGAVHSKVMVFRTTDDAMIWLEQQKIELGLHSDA
jgi:hypothetical protein